MRRALPLILAAFVLVPFATGCPTPTRTVEYSKSGEGHCPNCKTSQLDGATRCTVCETELRWHAQVSECWHCEGSGLCQVCRGFGMTGSGASEGEPCFACEDGKTRYPVGSCPHCEGTGTVTFGGS